MAPASGHKPTKAQRTAAARESARLAREEQRRKDRRNGLLARWGVVLAAMIVVALIVVVVVDNVRSRVPDAGPAPQGGNAQGGVTLLSSTQTAPTGTETVDVSTLPAEPAAQGTVPEGITAVSTGPLQVVAYVDANCVHCADFEVRHSEQVRSWLDAGKITFEYRTVAYLDRSSSTDYSSRAANAVACVADSAPGAFLDVNQRLFAHFEQGELDDDGLVTLAADAGAGDISECVDDGTFRPWVAFTTAAAQAAAVGGTPTVYVEGAVVLNAVEDFESTVQELLDARG